MKVNLTKLMEKVEKGNDIDKRNTSASYYLKTAHDITSSERAYSFELEKETFNLDK